MIETVYDELGRSWVEVDDEAWANATLTDYINGMPMLFPRR